MEQLVLCAPALERLECAIGTFSDELFVRLLASVKGLSLAFWKRNFSRARLVWRIYRRR